MKVLCAWVISVAMWTLKWEVFRGRVTEGVGTSG